jgi:hypothetical protein
MLSSRGPESSSTVAIEKNDDFNDDFVPAKHVPHQKNDSNDMDEDDGVPYSFLPSAPKLETTLISAARYVWNHGQPPVHTSLFQ